MRRPIAQISPITVIEFDRGTFDDWCVVVNTKGEKRYAPKDVEYFSRLQELGKVHGAEQIYNDFLKIYDRTTKEIDPKVTELITLLSNAYGKDAFEIKKWFVVLYAGMIAEENKAKAILKKRIKRLGMYQTMMLKMPPAEAAVFSKGKKWQALDRVCKGFGF